MEDRLIKAAAQGQGPFPLRSAMLPRIPNRFVFDFEPGPTPRASDSTVGHRAATKTNWAFCDNPAYFDEPIHPSFGGRMPTRSASLTRSTAPIPPRRPRFFKLPPPVPIHRFEMTNEDLIEEQDSDVFLNSSETEFNGNMPLPKAEKRASPFGKITQFFWKTKSNSKASVGSSSAASEGSRSRSTSSGICSPPFTPDSSLSIYTNSIDSDSHSSSLSQPSTGSDQCHYPEVHFLGPVKGHLDSNLDHDSLPPLPNYANIKSASFRGRTHSLPSPSAFPNRRFEIPSPTYYNTNAQNLETFQCPNTRRHSISSEPSSPCAEFDRTAVSPLSNGVGGYLVPIQTRPNCLAINQGPQYKNVYLNDLVANNQTVNGDRLENTVQVEVHTPTSSLTYSDMFCDSSASTAIPSSVYSYRRPHPLASLNRNPCSSDSSSTIEAAPFANGDENGAAPRTKPQAHSSKVRRDFAENGSDCEAYCRFCSSVSLPVVPPSRSSKMNVGILSCRGCFFSKSAVSQIIKIFETIVGPDRKKINVNTQLFDIQEIGENVKGIELHRAKIQIVVISHTFLDHIRHGSSIQKKMSPVNRILRSKRVIAVLLSGVASGGGGAASGNSASDVGDGFEQYLPEFSNWETLELKPSSKLDAEFYKKFTEKVMGLYSVEQRPPVGFSIFPKKVTKYQSKAVIFFKSAIEVGDKVSVQLGRGRKKEFIQEVILVNPYSGIIQMPASLFEDDRSVLIEITVTLNEQVLGSKALKYDHASHLWEDDLPETEELRADSAETPPTSCEADVASTNGLLTPAIEYYDLPRPAKQDYCIPPAARPVVPRKPKKLRPVSPIPEQTPKMSDPDDAENADHVLHYANIVSNSDENNS